MQETMQTRKILITGSGGLLGTPTVKAFEAGQGTQVLALGRQALDITDSAAVETRVCAFMPDLVVNCAAYTNVDGCESHEADASRVNGDGAGNVARSAAACGARLIHISTDYVFDGRGTEPYPEDHPTGDPAQLSAYGRSKLLGEQQVHRHHSRAIILRTAWLYGQDGPGFPQAILKRARAGGPLQVVTDQIGSPTYASDLAGAICKLAEFDVAGRFHFTNAGRCTWFDVAVEVLRLARVDMPVGPITSDQLRRPAKRPGFSVLDNRSFVAVTGQSPRSWQEALSDYVSSIPNAAVRS